MRMPCYDCTLKHLTKAKSYADAYEEDKDNKLNFMQAVGNLGQAEDEILGYNAEIAMTIRDFRLLYMDRKEVDWGSLLTDYYLVWGGDHNEPDYITQQLGYDGQRYRTVEDCMFIRTCECIVLIMEASLGYPEYLMDVIGILETLIDTAAEELEDVDLQNQGHAILKEMIKDPEYPFTPDCVQDLRMLCESIMVLRV